MHLPGLAYGASEMEERLEMKCADAARNTTCSRSITAAVISFFCLLLSDRQLRMSLDVRQTEPSNVQKCIDEQPHISIMSSDALKCGVTADTKHSIRDEWRATS